MIKHILITGLFSFSCFLAYAQENIQWRGTDRSGIYREDNLLNKWPDEGPALLWSYEGLGEGHSSVAIDKGKIYVTGMIDSDGYIFVFDEKGKLLNKKKYGKEWDKNYVGTRGTITLNDDKVYLISGMGVIYCFNQQDLSPVWQRNMLNDFNAQNIEWGINESPLIIDDKLIATPGGKIQNMVALNKLNGELIWSSEGEKEQAAYCSPLYIEDVEIPQIVTRTSGHVIGIDASNGKKLWSYANPHKYAIHANTPLYHEGMILISGGSGTGATMLQLQNGGRNVKEIWKTDKLENLLGGLVKIGDYVYGSGESNKNWFCVDWKTGDIKYQDKSLTIGNVIANKDMLYCYTQRGDMALVKADPEKMEISSQFKITKGTAQHWAHPVINNGILYVRHGDALMAYPIK